jgi:heptaprenyl diphosphate synthase
MFAIIQQDLLQVETELQSVIHSPVDTVNHIYTHLLQAGGKRLRPALYLLCAKSGALGRQPELSLAVAIELIHMATLVHDDVIDNAETRRSAPTANVLWGNHVSVLAGDYLFAKAFSIIAANEDHECLKKLTEIVCSICEGEIIQNKSAFDPDQTETEYLLKLAKKTADFIAVSCELGGIAAGHSPSAVQALRRYGYALGMAFQLTDDILDVVASAEQMGKPVGNDLRQGIITLPVIYALCHSPHSFELREIISSRDMSEAKVNRGLAIVHETGAVEYCYRRVSDYLDQARNALPSELNTDVRATLATVADFIGLRKY